MNINIKLFSLICLSFLLLSGCATFQQTDITCSNTDSTAHRTAIRNWDLKGAVAVNANGKGGNASMSWQQRGDRYTLALFGPFGANRVRLEGSPGQVSLHDGKAVQTAATPELLLEQQMGWSVPVNYLLYWVRGLPVPNIPVKHAQKMPDGAWSEFTQQGWRVQYLNYVRTGCAWLPTKLSMTHPTLHVRLVIRQWQIP
jgi:outer membrane lipoprotein LolB